MFYKSRKLYTFAGDKCDMAFLHRIKQKQFKI